MSDKYDSANECTQDISESTKLHIVGKGVAKYPWSLLGNWLIAHHSHSV